MDNRELCWKLLLSDSEDEVERILKDAGYWNKPSVWRPYGDLDNNYGTIGNQQGEAVAALVEKIVNSIDARLMNECLARGDPPESSQAPQSIQEAVHRYFGEGGHFDPDRSGRLSNWPDRKLNEEGDNITVAATGRRPEARRSASVHPSLSIADRGEGQSPDDFPSTFLSLHKSNKVRINFVQGKFNMGATGALPYCSHRYNFQLIVSRRNPGLLRDNNGSRASDWGFTIVRRRDPPGDSRSSVFEYLAPIGTTDIGPGEVLSFPADDFPIFPDRQGQPYSRRSSYGTLVKLYEYRWQGTSSSIIMPSDGSGLIRRIELALAEPALPVKLFECRGYQSNEVYRNVRGILTDLERNREDIEDNFPQSMDLAVSEQRLRVVIYTFKPGAYQSHRTNRHGVLFLYNGQMHASYSTRFFQRQSVRKNFLANDLLVLVDCSRIKRREFEDLFMNSRDRLRSDSKLAVEIEKKLEDYLLHDEALRALENVRRDAAKSGKDETAREDLLKDILAHNPDISRYLLEGALLTRVGRGPLNIERGHFEGKKFPSFFEPNRIEWNVGLGNKAQLQFQTDAENSYFTRSVSPGSWSISTADTGDWTNFWDRTGPNDGVARFYWDTSTLPPGFLNPGDSFEFTVTVSDESRVDPLKTSIKVNIIEPIEGSGGSRKKRAEKGTESVASPRIIPVYEPEWSTHQLGPFTSETACCIAPDLSAPEEREAWDFYINMDNEHIHHFSRTKDCSLETARNAFSTATVFMALALIRGDSSRTSSEADDLGNLDDLPEYVSRVTQYVAPVLLAVIDSLNMSGNDY